MLGVGITISTGFLAAMTSTDRPVRDSGALVTQSETPMANSLRTEWALRSCAFFQTERAIQLHPLHQSSALIFSANLGALS